MLESYKNRSNENKKKKSDDSEERIHLADQVWNDELDLFSRIIDFLLLQSCFDVLEKYLLELLISHLQLIVENHMVVHARFFAEFHRLFRFAKAFLNGTFGVCLATS